MILLSIALSVLWRKFTLYLMFILRLFASLSKSYPILYSFLLQELMSLSFQHWLDLQKRVCHQIKGISPVTLYLGVKYYAADPCKLAEEITRYQFFLQVKFDILQGRLPVPTDLSLELAALALQCKWIRLMWPRILFEVQFWLQGCRGLDLGISFWFFTKNV